MNRRLLTALLCLLIAPLAQAETEPVFTARFSDVAIKGYDPVAYFLDQRPVKGESEFSHQWQGAEWRFASNEHRELFAANPERWAPRYGGYCAWAVSQGSTASSDPDVWAIVEDKLYLNYSRKIQARWEADRSGNIASADENWPGVLEN